MQRKILQFEETGKKVLSEFCDAAKVLGHKAAEINSSTPLFSGSCGYINGSGKQYSYQLTKIKNGDVKVYEKRNFGYISIDAKIKRDTKHIATLVNTMQDSLSIMISNCVDERKIEKALSIVE